MWGATHTDLDKPLITMGKNPSLSNRRLAFSRLRDREIVGKLFDDIGIRFKDRPGGYLRILKTGYRTGDAAPMAIVQLVERKSVVAEPAEKPAKKKTPAKKAAPKKSESAAKEEKKEAKAAEKTAKKKTAKKAAKKTAKKAAKKKAAKKSD